MCASLSDDLDVIEELTKALHGIPTLAGKDGRTELVGMVESVLGRPLLVNRHADSWLDLVAIVRACLRATRETVALGRALRLCAPAQAVSALAILARINHGVPGLLPEPDRYELLDLLDGTVAPDDLAGLYLQATLPLMQAPDRADSLQAVVTELESKTNPYPLFAFLERLAAYNDQVVGGKLRRWIDAHRELLDERAVTRLTELRQELAGGPSVLGARTHLLVQLTADELDDDMYHVSAWIFPDAVTPAAHLNPEAPLALERVAGWLDDQLRRHGAGAMSRSRRPMIEFALDPAQLDEPVDHWEIGQADGSATRLGTRFPVVVRPMERPGELHAEWVLRWEVVARRHADPVAGSVRWLESFETTGGCPELPCTNDGCPDSRCLTAAEWACVAVTCADPSDGGVLADQLLAMGAPVALWVRGEHDGAARRGVLEKLIRGRELSRLPDSVRSFRENGWESTADDLRRELVLFWDDPARAVPRPYDLVTPTAQGA